jgi:hypothetical protein
MSANVLDDAITDAVVGIDPNHFGFFSMFAVLAVVLPVPSLSKGRGNGRTAREAVDRITQTSHDAWKEGWFPRDAECPE